MAVSGVMNRPLQCLVINFTFSSPTQGVIHHWQDGLLIKLHNKKSVEGQPPQFGAHMTTENNQPKKKGCDVPFCQNHRENPHNALVSNQLINIGDLGAGN